MGRDRRGTGGDWIMEVVVVIIDVVVLSQLPTPAELAGIGMIIGGVAVHQERGVVR
jgi:drug/metabolite transporter (DMT)-like permease